MIITSIIKSSDCAIAIQGFSKVDLCRIEALRLLLRLKFDVSIYGKVTGHCERIVQEGRSQLTLGELKSMESSMTDSQRWSNVDNRLNPAIKDPIQMYKCINATIKYLEGFKSFKMDEDKKVKIFGLCTIQQSPERIPNHLLIQYGILFENNEYSRLFRMKYGIFICVFVALVIMIVLIAIIFNVILGCKRYIKFWPIIWNIISSTINFVIFYRSRSSNNRETYQRGLISAPPLPPRTTLPSISSMIERPLNHQALDQGFLEDLPPSYDQVLAMNKSISNNQENPTLSPSLGDHQ